MSFGRSSYDAIVVGSGPNGLAAAITLAQAGQKVVVVEARPTLGGGMRTAEITLPGFRHDVCSAIHPLALESPFFRQLPRELFNVEWIVPPVAAAHPMPDGSVAAMYRDLRQTLDALDVDAKSYERLVAPLVKQTDRLFSAVLQRPTLIPTARPLWHLGWHGFASAKRFAQRHFQNERVRGMFAGMAAHSILPLDFRLTAAVGLMFCATLHTNGWPLPRGGSQSIADALTQHFLKLGGECVTELPVRSLGDLPESRVVAFDLTCRQVAEIARSELPSSYVRTLRKVKHGPGVFKIDYALREPVPWTAAECRQAGTVHCGGSIEEIAASEHAAWNGRDAERPFVLVAQQSLFDDSRAPHGKQTLWAYCHLPRGSSVDMTERIESQIERFAPGFRDVVLHRHVHNPAAMENYNANYVGGDITGGAMTMWQTIARPTFWRNPYCTPNPRLYLCSSATPPGPGVHGMCGYHAARQILARWR